MKQKRVTAPMIFQRSDSFHIHESESKKCVTVYVNGNFEEGRKLYVEPEWSMRDFLQACSHRLETGTIASRVFNSDGADLDDPMLLDDNGMVFLSDGEPFIRPTMLPSTDPPEQASKDENMPSLVGGYQVGSLLGKGGFGEVRVGAHQLTGERVALKFLKKSEIMSMGAAERTVTEIQCLMAMKHANIIRLFQHVESMHHYVLIFELMEGGDLWGYQRNLGETRGPDIVEGGFGLPPMALREEVARAVFHQIVSGIAYAHNQHICHRDLKLENILLKNKNLEVVKIADFGLSAFYRPGTNLQTNCGTLSFLAPEVFKGTANAGPPLDVWALGVILFSMLCGRLPFEGTDLSYARRPRTPIIRARILKCQYKIDESLSPEVKDLVRRMLRLDPTERATVPEIFNHFWLRGAGSGSAMEMRRERSSTNVASTTVFASVVSAKDLSRESSERSTELSKSPAPPSLSPAVSENNGMGADMTEAVLEALDGEAGVTKTEDSLDQVLSTSPRPEQSMPAPQVFKLVPLRRTIGANMTGPEKQYDSDGSAGPDMSNNTTRRARAMLSEDTDSLRELTESVTTRHSEGSSTSALTRFQRARSQPANGLLADFHTNITKEEKRLSGYHTHDHIPPPISSAHNSPKNSARGSSTFFSAGSASLNTHTSMSSSAAPKRFDTHSSGNGRSPLRDFK